jgi:hypothetical protein
MVASRRMRAFGMRFFFCGLCMEVCEHLEEIVEMQEGKGKGLRETEVDWVWMLSRGRKME